MRDGAGLGFSRNPTKMAGRIELASARALLLPPIVPIPHHTQERERTPQTWSTPAATCTFSLGNMQAANYPSELKGKPLAVQQRFYLSQNHQYVVRVYLLISSGLPTLLGECTSNGHHTGSRNN